MIRIVDDLVPPAIVAGIDILLDKSKPTWNQPVGIALSAAGYILGGVMGIGGTFMKNLGIAAAPWAFESIYHYIAGGAHIPARASGRLTMRPAGRVGTYPAQPKDTGLWPVAV